MEIRPTFSDACFGEELLRALNGLPVLSGQAVTDLISHNREIGAVFGMLS
jgi:hypothetical protein